MFGLKQPELVTATSGELPGLPKADTGALRPAPEAITTLKGGDTIDYRVAANVEPNAVGLEIARRAESITNGRTQSTGWCLAKVNDATEPVTGIRRTNWAIQAGEAYAESKDYVEVTGFDPRGKSLDEIENFLNGMPPGTVAIYDKNKMGFDAPGHAQIRGTDGKWHSDFEHGALVYGGGVTILRVFIPVSSTGDIKVGQGPFLGDYSSAPITESDAARASAAMSRFQDTLNSLRPAEPGACQPGSPEEEEEEPYEPHPPSSGHTPEESPGQQKPIDREQIQRQRQILLERKAW